MHTIVLCNQPIIDIYTDIFCSFRQCMQMNQYWKLSSISVGFCLFLLKPLFSYWKLAQCPATVFIWSTCLLTKLFVPFPLVSCRCTCYNFFFFFGASVLIQFFSGLFRSICSHIVLSVFLVAGAAVLIQFFLGFFGASVLISFCLCFLLPEQLFSYSLFWVFSEHMFSYSFFLLFFWRICSHIVLFYFFWLPQHLFSCICNMKQPAAILVLPVL